MEEKTHEKKEIKESKSEKQIKDYIRDYFFRNKFVSVFTSLFIFTLLISILNYSGVSTGNNILSGTINLFSFGLWFFLAIMFGFSSVLAYYKKYNLMFLPLIIWLLFTAAVIRTSNIPELRNAATGELVLGPDLDPYLFLRNAIEISEGNVDQIDKMRQAPIGTTHHTSRNIMALSIFLVYQTINIFGNYSITYAGIIAPVIFFLISIIGFFLFVYFLFSFKFSKERSLAGATIASFFYAFIPSMLHRTAAGIPELESLGIVWFWLAFLFFILSWKQEKAKKIIFYGLLAGFFTGIMGWTWGGYKYIYLVITFSSFLIFLLEKERRKNLIIFSSWFIPAVILEILRYRSIVEVIGSITDVGLALFIFLVLIIRNSLDLKKIKSNKYLNRINNINLPKPIISILILILFGIVFLMIFSPGKLIELPSQIIERFFTPFGGGRVGTTVAENRISYFTDVLNSFGYLVWLFLFGCVVLFFQGIKHFETKKKIILNLSFILFLIFFVFSSYGPNAVLNGENTISKIMYSLAPLILIGSITGIYLSSFIKKDRRTIEDFKKIEINYLILLGFVFFGIMFMRSAVRFFFLISPILILMSCYLIIKITDFLKSKDEAIKLFSWFGFIFTVIILFSSFINYSQATTMNIKQIVPSIYNQQWHHAMNWVATETSEDAIFVHWWDYGYWVQTLGQRATLTDGGHPNFWFTYSSARYILTTPKPETALSMFKSLGLSYLLIDSTDLGKYPPYSKIGSDENWDRLSSIGVFVSDSSQKQETRAGEKRIYTGGWAVDEDIVYEKEDKKIFIPGSVFDEQGNMRPYSYLAGIIFETSELIDEDNETQQAVISFNQPEGIFFHNNQRYDIPIRYIYYNHQLHDYGTGIDSIVMIIPKAEQTNTGGLILDHYGAMIYLSERTKDGLFAQLYLMNDVNNRYPTIKLAHVEEDYAVKFFKQQQEIGNFIYYHGFRGPIKIWDLREIPDNILTKEEFLNTGPHIFEWGFLDDVEFLK